MSVAVAWYIFYRGFYLDLREPPLVTCVAVKREMPADDGYDPRWCRGLA